MCVQLVAYLEIVERRISDGNDSISPEQGGHLHVKPRASECSVLSTPRHPFQHHGLAQLQPLLSGEEKTSMVGDDREWKAGCFPFRTTSAKLGERRVCVKGREEGWGVGGVLKNVSLVRRLTSPWRYWKITSYDGSQPCARQVPFEG